MRQIYIDTVIAGTRVRSPTHVFDGWTSKESFPPIIQKIND
jgi:hypothetical protein